MSVPLSNGSSAHLPPAPPPPLQLSRTAAFRPPLVCCPHPTHCGSSPSSQLSAHVDPLRSSISRLGRALVFSHRRLQSAFAHLQRPNKDLTKRSERTQCLCLRRGWLVLAVQPAVTNPDLSRGGTGCLTLFCLGAEHDFGLISSLGRRS